MTTSRAARPEPGFSDSLRAQCDRIWAGLHAHPFLRELARGTLPLDRFRFFIEQDLLFLPAFARCMALGAAKSGSETELDFFSRQLDGIIRLEMPSNRRLLDQVISLGAEDRGGSLGMAPANVAYTSFLLATAAAGGPLEITAAILPCSWSYIEIARGLKDQLAEHPVYADWVGFYLQEEEADLVKNMRETFDQMTRREVMSDDRRSQLGEIFTMSSRLEGMFWEMVYTLDQWPDLAPPDQASLAFTPVLRRRRPGSRSVSADDAHIWSRNSRRPASPSGRARYRRRVATFRSVKGPAFLSTVRCWLTALLVTSKQPAISPAASSEWETRPRFLWLRSSRRRAASRQFRSRRLGQDLLPPWRRPGLR